MLLVEIVEIVEKCRHELSLLNTERLFLFSQPTFSTVPEPIFSKFAKYVVRSDIKKHSLNIRG